MKRKITYLFATLSLVFFLSISATQIESFTFATGESQIDTSEQIEEEIANQLDNLDFSQLDQIIAEFNGQSSSIFGNSDFLAKVEKLLAGEFDDGESLFSNIISIFFDSLLGLLPLISIIIAISLASNMIHGLKPSTNGKSITNIIHFVSYGVVVVLILSIVIKMISLASTAILSVQNQMNSIFPLLLTLLTAIGGTTSASVYQPAMTLLSNSILNFFTYILLPLFIFSIVFSIVSNLSNTVKLDKFANFFNSCFKWMVGLVFTIFTAFVSLQGITAGSIDGISLRTAKYAIRSYVPVIGGYIGDGMGLILASTNLIKNSVGVAGLFMMVASVLSPLIELILFMLALKFVAGIIEPLGNRQIANLVSSLSKSMVLLIVLLIGVVFVYFILLGLVMCSANIF